MSVVEPRVQPVAAPNFLTRWVDVRAGEWPGVIAAFGCAFLMFTAYALLRPIRETMGVTSGVAALPALFWGTFAAMLVAQPVYGWLLRRHRRSVLLPRIYQGIAATLVGLYLWFHLATDHTLIARVYFVWVSVFNYLMVAIFWSLMTDVFSREQAGRLFGLIAGGLSCGGLTGALLAGWLATPLGTSNLLLVSALVLVAASLCMQRVDAWQRACGTRRDAGQALAGGAWEGFALVARSPYLIGIALFVLMLSASTTILYVEQNRAVAAAIQSADARTALFGRIDFWVQVAALLGQMLVFGPLLSRIGFRAMLCATPLLMIVAFAALLVAPSLQCALAAIVLRRVAEYALTRPSRDMLFTVLSRAEKYKAKNVLDTFVYRGGDALSATLYGAVAASAGTLPVAGIAGLLVCAAWIAISLWLGTHFARRARAEGAAHAHFVA